MASDIMGQDGGEELAATTETQIRVRYAETDAMGIVYYGHYLLYFEVARNEHFRQLGLSLAALEAQGFYEAAVEAHIRYLAPSRYDDLLSITTRTEEIRNRGWSLSYEVRRSDDATVVALGRTVHVFLDREGQAVEIPAQARAILEGRGPRGDA